MAIPPGPDSPGSSANGGELLFLALATCYCNDVYREARKRKVEITAIDVRVIGDFGAEGERAKNISYSAVIEGNASREELLALMKHTDTVSEIQNTLRASTPVLLTHCEARSL